MKIFDPQLTGSIEIENPISGSVTTLGNIIALGSDSSLSGSFSGSFSGDGAGITGAGWDGQFTGSATISGSLNIVGDTEVTISSSLRAEYFGVWSGSYAGYLAPSGELEGNTTNDLGLGSETGKNIRFYTNKNTTEKMRLTTDGNLGIGTTSPSAKLHSYINTSTPTVLGKFENLGGEGIIEIKSKNDKLSVLQFADSEDGNVGAVQYFHQDNEMQFKTNDSVKLRISSGGDVVLNQALSVIKGGGSSTGRFQVANHDTTSYMMITGNTYPTIPNTTYFVNNSVVALTISSAGDATFSGSVTADQGIFNSTANTYLGGSLILRDLNGANPKYLTSVSGNLAFSANGTNDHLLISSGGTATFNGIVSINGQGFFRGDSSGNLRIQGGTTATEIRNNSNNSSLLTILDGGNVGIGKSPSTFRLDLETTSGGNGLKITRGTADFQVFQVANGASYVGTGNADTLHLITGGSSKMSISSGGLATFSNDIELSRAARTTIYASSTNQGVQLKSNGTGVLQLNADGGGDVKIAENGGLVSTADLKVDGSFNSNGNATMYINGAAAVDPSWIYWQQGSNLRWLSGLEGSSTDFWFLSYGSSGNGMPRLILKENGNVGIGLSNPSSKLHLDGSNYNTASETQFTITDHGNNYNSGDTSCRIVMESRYWSGDDNVSTRSAITNIKDNGNGSSGSAMAFHTTNQSAGAYSEKMRITSGGTVQIYGTASANSLNIDHSSSNDVLISIPFQSVNQDFIIRNSSAGVNLDYAATSWVSASDENIKENITSLDNVLDKIKNIRCVNYNLKDEEIYKKRLGFIAQDFQENFEEVTSINNNDVLGLRYTETIPILLKAIQEQQAQIEELKSEIQLLKNN